MRVVRCISVLLPRHFTVVRASKTGVTNRPLAGGVVCGLARAFRDFSEFETSMGKGGLCRDLSTGCFVHERSVLSDGDRLFAGRSQMAALRVLPEMRQMRQEAKRYETCVR